MTASFLRVTLYAQLGNCQYQHSLLREQIDTLNTLAFPAILKADGPEDRKSIAAIIARKGYFKQESRSAMDLGKEKWNMEVEAFAKGLQNTVWENVGERFRNAWEHIKAMGKNR